ncbi:ureidoglycolate hydrolase [Ramicandelaber brevisporus]|nr:ureidoglycolate hydrolase [Ramicandelaber brevisporus]
MSNSSSTLFIRAEPLTAAAFAPYGQVIESTNASSVAANAGTAARFNRLAALVNHRQGTDSHIPATANLCIFQCRPQLVPSSLANDSARKSLDSDTSTLVANSFVVKMLERHPYSSQMFVPMARTSPAARYLVVVSNTIHRGADAENGGVDEPDMNSEGSLRAFIANATQGINYNAGTWHHPMVALDDTIEFLTLVYENGVAEQDCHEVPLTQMVQISL